MKKIKICTPVIGKTLNEFLKNLSMREKQKNFCPLLSGKPFTGEVQSPEIFSVRRKKDFFSDAAFRAETILVDLRFDFYHGDRLDRDAFFRLQENKL